MIKFRLKVLLAMNDMNQKELSEKTNIPQASISKFENGRNVPSLQILQRLADGLGKRLIVDFVEPEEEN